MASCWQRRACSSLAVSSPRGSWAASNGSAGAGAGHGTRTSASLSPRRSRAAALEVNGLTRRFGGVTAVDDVSFAVNQGEVFGVIGPNGAGKTTLFNLVTGVTPPSSGTLLHDGTDITTARPHQVARRGIARTFQNIRLFSELRRSRT